jgi:hypothetical protein
MRSRIHASATLVLLGLSIAACDDKVSAPTSGPNDADLRAARSGAKLERVVITTTDTTLRKGQSARMTARLEYSDGGTLVTRRHVEWRSLDTTTVKVFNRDRVLGRKDGSTRVIAEAGGKADTIRMYVSSAAESDSSATDSGSGADDGAANDSTTAGDSTASSGGSTGGETGSDTTATPPADTGSGGSTTEPETPVVIPPPPTGPFQLAELPRERVDTRLVAPTGRRLSVQSGGLQAAIDSARPGDVLLLQPGSTFNGHFRLRRKSGDGWITIRTASDAGLPAPGTRMTPSVARSASLPRILTPDVAPAIQTEPGAHHYRIIGVEVGAASGVTLQYGLVKFGSSGTEQNMLSQVPHHLILDRVYVHGQSGMHLKRCVTLNSAWSAVIDSYLSECHGKGQDTQAILGWNGPGPFKIVNNVLEGAGENIMFGGADPSISGLIPADIEIRNNYVHKPASWKGVYTVKNLLEFKNAQRVLVEGNVFDGSWADAQSGLAWNIKSANQSGNCNWCVTQHVTLRYNLIRNAGSGIVVTGGEALTGGTVGRTNHITIMENRMERIDIEGTPYVGVGRPFQISGAEDLVINHNTIDNSTTSVLAMFVANVGARFYWLNNVGYKGQYGMHALATYAPNAVISGNAFVGSAGSSTYSTYGTGNIIVSSLSAGMSALGTDAQPIGCSQSLLTQSIQSVGP